MANFQSQSHKFTIRGVNLRFPVDKLPPGYVPKLSNLRCLTESSLQPRNGVNQIADTGTGAGVRQLRRLNDSIAGTFARVVQCAGNLYVGSTGALPIVDTGYSDVPCSMVPFRPDNSPRPWMYIADKAKMRKVQADGTNYKVGINPPRSAPTLVYGQPQYTVVDTFDAIGAWNNTGTAGVISLVSRVNTTISQSLYDVGGGGWCSIIPASYDSNLQEGMFLQFAGAEYAKVRRIYPAISNSTIASIIYDVVGGGNTGFCSIQLTTATSGLQRDCIVQLGGEYVRVLSVTLGKDGIPSFRCSTVSAHGALETVTGYTSFRVYLFAYYPPGNTITKNCFSSNITAGQGFLSLSSAFNLNQISSPAASPVLRTLQPDDYIHISLLVSDPSQVAFGRIYFDIDKTANDFQHNAYYYEFRPSDFQPNVSGAISQLTSAQIALQRQIIDDSVGNSDQYYSSSRDQSLIDGLSYANTSVANSSGFTVSGTGISNSSTQQTPGTAQWTEILIQVSSLLKNRIGSDKSRTLANVAKIGVELTATGPVNFCVDSWWIGGTYGLGVGATGSPLLSCYRYRSSTTGAVSNPSPAVRSGLRPMSERVIITVAASTDPQVDKIDVYHFGANRDEWKLMNTVPNVSGTVNDDYSTLSTAANPLAVFDDYVPFPTIDLPRKGICNVSGTSVQWVSGDKFNFNWVPGSVIILAGQVCTLYESPLYDTVLTIVESAGVNANTAFLLPEATIQGTTLPAMWGPFGGTDIGNVMFGVGDVNQPGLLYWTKPSRPDNASDRGYVEVTSPSEPLINGFTYDGRAFVFSSQRLFAIFGSINQTNGDVTFTTQEVPNGKGLIGLQAFCVGSTFFWVDRTGIWTSAGGAPKSITDEDLYPMFPRDGAQSTVPINGYYPPDFTSVARLNLMKLSYTQESLYWMYFDIIGNYICMRYDLARQGWFPSDYAEIPTLVYSEEGQSVDSVLIGTAKGKLGQFSTQAKDTFAGVDYPINCSLWTAADDLGQSRITKLFGDWWFDINTDSTVVTIIPSISNLTTDLDSIAPIGAARTLYTTVFNGGLGITAKNLGYKISWASTTRSPRLYEYQFTFVPKVEEITSRATDIDQAGYPGNKYVQGMRLRADTGGVNVSVQILGDSGVVVIPAFTINHNGESTIPYSWIPFIAHDVRLQPLGASLTRIMSVEWIYEPQPEVAFLWQTQGTTYDLPGFHHHRDCYISIYSPQVGTITLVLAGDFGSNSYTINVVVGQQKVYIPLGPNKSTLTSLSLTASFQFGVYKRDCEIRVKAWGSVEGFISKNPFGDLSRIDGARI